jgi:3-phenylpropionate/trans-cinnamate dioxygenase ferredoxin subunit
MTFQRACALSELTDSTPLRVEVDGLDVAVVRHNEEVFAIEDECSHASVALSEGAIEVFGDDCTIECWMHGSRFDLRTGKPTGPPATEPVPIYPVQINGDDVLIDLGDN